MTRHASETHTSSTTTTVAATAATIDVSAVATGPTTAAVLCRRNAKLRAINAQSIRNKTTEFIEFSIENNLDVIAICETWLKPEDNVIIGNVIPAGYSFKQVPRATQKRGGGIALVYKTGYLMCVSQTLVCYQDNLSSYQHNSSPQSYPCV